MMRIPMMGGRRGGATATDPVCNMDADIANPPGGSWDHEGETYYFCGPGCNRAFQKEPQAYLSGDKSMDMGN